MLSFNETHTEADLEKLVTAFESKFGKATGEGSVIPVISENLLRQGSADMPTFSAEQIREYYKNLGQQNISPDNSYLPSRLLYYEV